MAWPIIAPVTGRPPVVRRSYSNGMGMAAKPIERFVKRQIQEQGGWPRILERIASGATYTELAGALKRPDGDGISFGFFRRLLHQDPAREPAIREAKRIRAEAWAEQALTRSDTVPADRDEVAKARVQIDTRLRLASLADREQFGDSKQALNVTVQVATLHVDALRHRIIEASRPLAAVLAEGSGGESASNGGRTRVEQVGEQSVTVDSIAAA